MPDGHARSRATAYPLGAAVTLAELEMDPHPVLQRLREREPVSWLPAIDGWLVTRRDLALQAMRDARTFTVDDPRFSTARIVGPSMLSLDGAEHARHRDPFARPFRLDAVRERFTEVVEAEVDRLLDPIAARGSADLRRELAGPLSVRVMVRALGLEETDPSLALSWYADIVAAVTAITAGEEPGPEGTRAFAALTDSLGPALERDPSASLVAAASADADRLRRDQVASNAAVLLFGGIETTEAMIANAFVHLLADERQTQLVHDDPALARRALEESLRLEPAAAVIDRYTTCATRLGDAAIGERELVRLSLAGANRDPHVFPEPDRFDVLRDGLELQVAFAHGPHVCLGMHLARLEGRVALQRTLARLPGLRLDPGRPARIEGLVFRKPEAVHVIWDGPGATLSR